MSEQPLIPEVLDLQAVDGPAFRQWLVDARNVVAPEDPVDGFDSRSNFVMETSWVYGGEPDGAGHRFPRPSDKPELIDYGLRKAQQASDPHNAAIIASATVVIVHPFHDRNAGLSREMYKHLVTGKPIAALQSQNGHPGSDIDFGRVWDRLLGMVARIRDREVCTAMGVDYNLISHQRVATHLQDDNLNEVERVTLTGVETIGLTPEEVGDLVDVIGADKFGNTYGKDTPGLNYAVAAMSRTHESVRKINQEVGRAHVFNLRTFLSTVTPEEKKLFISKLWEYRREAARASIDLLSDDGGGAKWADYKGSRITLRDYIIARMNHLKPEGRSDADLLGQAALAAQRVVS